LTMPVKRTDHKGRRLREGESQRKNLLYQFRYTDENGKRRTIYASDLKELREKEAAIKKDREDGIRFSGGQITVTELAERYIDLKQGVRYNTKVGYRYVLNLLKKEEFSGLSVESGWMTGTLLGQLKIVIWLRTAGAGSTAVSCTGFYDWYITFGKSIF
ncbi:MAG: integrase DNA-binding domain-containing protein, partial [Butyrivibrio hungatei]|nr:integrase DNA-binding domain-containing protein [Butyrivibrio hungatei]